MIFAGFRLIVNLDCSYIVASQGGNSGRQHEANNGKWEQLKGH